MTTTANSAYRKIANIVASQNTRLFDDVDVDIDDNDGNIPQFLLRQIIVAAAAVLLQFLLLLSLLSSIVPKLDKMIDLFHAAATAAAR